MTPKDFFMYLGAAITLYASAGALVGLLFSIIGILLPDALNPQPMSSWSTGGMRFAISTLLVAFPLYIVLSWLIRKDIAHDIHKYQLSIRRWFIYFTLFIAGAAVAGDIIALVNTYLSGEISGRFIWKMLAVFVVAAVIFAYYLYDLRRAESKDRKVNTMLIVLAIVGVVAVIVWGILVAGSPSEVRALRFDELRANALSELQWRITEYYQGHAVLPATLDLLSDDIKGYRTPVDPETQEPYEYTVLNSKSLSFELCAVFNQANIGLQGETKPVYDGVMVPDENFAHDAGRVCFERTIDPKNYPLFKQ